MIFAEFQIESTGWNGKDFSGPKTLVPMLGSDGVFRCDGRKCLRNQIEDAKTRAKQIPHVKGLKMFRSHDWRYTNGKPITGIIPIS
jgi:hypothetical protein